MSRGGRLVVLSLIVLCLGAAAFCIQHQFARQRLERLQTASLSFARGDWPEQRTIADPAELLELQSAWRLASYLPGTPPNREDPVYRLTLTTATQTTELWLTHDLQVYTAELNQQVQFGPSGLRLLAAQAEQLRRLRFGELLAWSEASQLLPRYSVFTVTDVETGLSFRSQRRAGTQHADIQPLTKQDTEILRQIYGGTWSWDRRAVVVTSGDRRIAASMNGMPHGAGALVNGFPGHHCLHFLGSITHGGGNCDPMHQLMVQKAAGRLLEYLEQTPPDQLSVLALELAGQGDTAITGLIIINSGDGLEQLSGEISNIKLWSCQPGVEQSGRLTGRYSLSVFFRGDAREHRTTVELTCRYVSDVGKWLLEPDYLQQLHELRK